LPLGVAVYLLLLRGHAGATAAAIAVVAVAAASDFLDGYAARRLGAVTTTGKWLDAACDAVFFLFVYLSFVRVGLMPPLLLALFACRELTQYAVLRPLSMARNVDPGARLPGKIKTVLQSVGSAAVLLLLLIHQQGHLSARSLSVAATSILALLVAVSLLSLGWYIAPLVRQAARG